jgi:hypothetical protein
LPNGPASKIAGGSHCSGPVRTNVESGAGGAAGAAAGAAAASGVAGAAGVDVCAGAFIARTARKAKRLWHVRLRVNYMSLSPAIYELIAGNPVFGPR